MQAWFSEKGKERKVNIYPLSVAPAGFSSEKEAAEPKAESVFQSKAVRVTMAFAKGFVVGFIAPYLLYDRAHGNFEMVQMPAAIILGGLNAAREMYGDAEQNSKDNVAFLKWSIPSAILTSAVFSMPFVVLGSGTAFGALSVAYHRYTDKRKA